MTLATFLRPRISFRHEALWMRLTARAVLAGWLLPLVFALFVSLASAPAQAQDAQDPSAIKQTVVVLDFATGNGIDPLLGRKAADALVVELQRTNEFIVVSRQQLQEVVGQQAGLQPPFDSTAQQKLAQAALATSVFSGQINRLDVVPGQSARVGVVVRQLDAATGDYINGTQNIEPTEQKLTPIPNEILIDEAINKVAFAAVRSMRQTTLPFGSVLNTTRDDLEMSIGARNGVSPGQRYSVLRDVFNQGRNATERLKVGEVTVKRVDADQATAVVTGGQAGVHTGDFVRQIYVAPRSPLTLTNGSSTPVSSPPSGSGTRRGGLKGGLGQGLLGVLGLAALVTLVGFGGGSNKSTPQLGQPFESNPSGVYPQPAVRFQSGFTGISLSRTLQQEAVVGYVIYRGTSSNFSATTDTIQGFIDARNLSAGQLSFSEPIIPSGSIGTTRTVTISSNNVNGGTTGTTNGNTGSSSSDTLNVSVTNVGLTANSFAQTNGQIIFTFTQRPLQIGQQYFYRIQRISAERINVQNNNNNNNGNNGNNNNSGSTVNLLPFTSPSSNSTGGYTPLLRPVIVPTTPDATGIAYDLANFSVRLNANSDIVQFSNTTFVPGTGNVPGTTTTFFNSGYSFPPGVNVTTGANDFQVQVSTTSTFTPASTFVSQDFPAPVVDPGSGDAILAFPSGITLPTAAGFVVGQSQLFIRVLSRNTTDAAVNFRISPTLVVDAAQVTDSRIISALSSRFVSQPHGGIRIGQGRGLNGALSSGGIPRTGVSRPK